MDDTQEKPKRSRLAKAMRRNIDMILDVRKEMEQRRSLQDKMADTITKTAGSMTFIICHAVWFLLWMTYNVGLWGGGVPFDKWPFGLLTMIVSLEAIFLSAFVLVSQNRMSRVNDKRDDLDLQVTLLGEYEVTKILKILDAIGNKLGVEMNDPELRELEMEISAKNVLREMERQEDKSQREKKQW
jgi:uncharacterized membrane protein